MGGSDFISLRLCGVAAGAILALSSCTFLFNPDDLTAARDGGAEPPADAEPLDPGEFGISGVMPSSVLEGEGTAWAVPVIVSGQEFTSDIQVVLNGAGFDQQEVPAVIYPGGRSLAFPLRVPVLPDTGRGDTAVVVVTVRQGTQSDTIPVVITGLDELVLSDLGETTLSAADLDPLYSRIVIDQDVDFIGNDPIRLVATAEIQLQARVTADGQEGAEETNVGAPGGAGGPGGCAGGSLQAAGDCGTGGGGGNQRDDSAGGGGHGTMGTPGGGNPTAPGGAETGRPDLVPLASERGNGGGGSAQGTGGGGGGIVELTSQGTFTISDNAEIFADGGRGGPGRCEDAVVVGSGGGGSGGTILLRSWNAFNDLVNEPRLSVRGGAGGLMGPNDDCVEAGGAGGFGRVRVDTAGLNGLPRFAEITPEPFQGPLFRNIDNAGTPVSVITTQSQITLEATGQRSTGFTLDVNGTTQPLTMSAGGTASVVVQLGLGLNKICAKTSADTLLFVSEGVQCISIVSIQ
jgi:hypothetical protein